MFGIVVGDTDGDAEGAPTEGLLESGVIVLAGLGRTGFGVVGWEALLGIPVKPAPIPVAGAAERSAAAEGTVGVFEGGVVAGVGRSTPGLNVGVAFVETGDDETSGPLDGVADADGLAGRGVTGLGAASVEAAGNGVVTSGLFIAGVTTGTAGFAGTFETLAGGLELIGVRLMFVVGALGWFAAVFATVPGLLGWVLISGPGFLSVSEMGVCLSPRNMKYPPADSTITKAKTTPSLTSVRMTDSFRTCG